MWYNTRYENTHFYPTFHRRRTAPDPGRIAFVRCFCVTSLPGLTGLSPRRTSFRDRPPAWVRRPDGSQRDPRLQCRRPRRLAGTAVAPASLAHHLFRGGSRTPQRPATPQPARFWQRAQHLDLGTGRPGQFRAGYYLNPRLRRERAPRPQTTENQLEARQALDHQPRPAIPAKKNARDRLMAWASAQPNWAIGFLDEVWWSRFALPRMHAWQHEDH